MRSAHNKNKPIAMQETASLRNENTSSNTTIDSSSSSINKHTSATGNAPWREAVQMFFCPRGAMVFVWMFIFLCCAQIYVELFIFREHKVDSAINDMMQWNRKANANFTLSPRLQNVIGVRLINGNQLMEVTSLAGHQPSSESSSSSAAANKFHRPAMTTKSPPTTTTWSTSANVSILSNISFRATYEWNLSESDNYLNDNRVRLHSVNKTNETSEEENEVYTYTKALCFTSLTTHEMCRLPVNKMNLSREARFHRRLRLCQNADMLLLLLPEVAELEQMQRKYSHRLHTLEPILAKNKYKDIIDDDEENDVCWSNNKAFTIANYHFPRAFIVPEATKLQNALPEKGKKENIRETTDNTLGNNKNNGNDVSININKTKKSKKKNSVKIENGSEMLKSISNNSSNNGNYKYDNNITKLIADNVTTAKNDENKYKETFYETHLNINLAHSFALIINYTEERQRSGKPGRRNEDAEFINLLEVTKFTEIFNQNRSFTPVHKSDFFYDAYSYLQHHQHSNVPKSRKKNGVVKNNNSDDNSQEDKTKWNPSNSTGIVCFISSSLHNVEVPGVYTYDNKTNKIYYSTNTQSHSNINRNLFNLKEQINSVRSSSHADNNSTEVPQIVYFASHMMEWFRAHWIVLVSRCDSTNDNVHHFKNNDDDNSNDQTVLSHKWSVPYHIMPAQRELYWLCFTQTGILEYRPHQDWHTFYDVTEKEEQESEEEGDDNNINCNSELTEVKKSQAQSFLSSIGNEC